MKNKSLRKSSGKVNEGWTSFFEDTLDRLIAASGERAETARTEPDEETEETLKGELPSETLAAGLADMLGDLREAADEAREERFPVPSDAAMTNSERLIKRIYGISPGRHGIGVHLFCNTHPSRKTQQG